MCEVLKEEFTENPLCTLGSIEDEPSFATASSVYIRASQSQEGTNVHFSNMHFVLCQIFGLNHLTPPFHAFFPPPPPWANASPKKGQAMQRRHDEQSARSKSARLPLLDRRGRKIGAARKFQGSVNRGFQTVVRDSQRSRG